MKFAGPVHHGVLVRRYQRFLADVRLDDGRTVTAHCPNPGSMKSCLVEGMRVWLTYRGQGKRKLPWTWEVGEIGRVRIYLNPAGANDVVAEALTHGAIPELARYPVREREVRCGSGSRLDFRLSGGTSAPCWVEVKNVTLDLGGGRTAFPDAKTERGVRHLEQLSTLRRRGERAVLLFSAARSDAASVEPARDIDPRYADALERAAHAGVELYAYRCAIRSTGVVMSRSIPVIV